MFLGCISLTMFNFQENVVVVSKTALSLFYYLLNCASFRQNSISPSVTFSNDYTYIAIGMIKPLCYVFIILHLLVHVLCEYYAVAIAL